MKKCFYGQTDIGLKRSSNQDGFFAQSFDENRILTVVCDGMGGAQGGNVASKLVLETFTENVESHFGSNEFSYLDILPKALDKANKTLLEMANENPELSGMGTTFVTVIYDAGRYYCMSVGDSRIYLFSSGKIKQLTHDHSYVQTLVDSGQITKEEAKTHPNRNIITNAVGTKQFVDADMFVISQVGIDGVLLCSDGLSGYVDEEKLKEVFYKKNISTKQIVEEYIEMAKNAGGDDNITAVVIRNADKKEEDN